MYRWTLCENVDSDKIKVPIYTTNIDIIYKIVTKMKTKNWTIINKNYNNISTVLK